MKPKTNIILIFVLLLSVLSTSAQLRQKSFNFVDEGYESASGTSEKILPELTFVNFKGIDLKKEKFKPLTIRSLNVGKQTKYKTVRTKETVIKKFIRSNLKVSFRISRNMNMTISYI